MESKCRFDNVVEGNWKPFKCGHVGCKSENAEENGSRQTILVAIKKKKNETG